MYRGSQWVYLAFRRVLIFIDTQMEISFHKLLLGPDLNGFYLLRSLGLNTICVEENLKALAFRYKCYINNQIIFQWALIGKPHAHITLIL